MVRSIEKNSSIRLKELDEENFFRDLLIKCYEKNLLENIYLEKLNHERLNILKTQLKYYTKDSSSSVMIEVAENILDSIDYTISVHLKTFSNLDLLLKTLKETELFDIFLKGQDLIKEYISLGQKLLSIAQKSKLEVNNYSYNDTIDYGLPPFFKEYEYFYSSHESPGSIDYQLSIGDFNNSGIEYINNYLKILILENNFCNNFNINDINSLLQSYDRNCDELLINIFELVLINSLGCLICDKDVKNLNITNLDREHIKNKLLHLSSNTLEDELLNYLKRYFIFLDIKDNELINYINMSTTLKIAPLIKESLNLNKFEKVFISFNLNYSNRDTIEYMDGKKSSNAYFRNLTNKIRNCLLTEDKIHLIKNNIHSLEDLIDILEAECLYENEFNDLFQSLSDIEIALLLKNVPYLSFQTDYEKEWHIKFNVFFSCLNEEKQKALTILQEKIKLI